MHVERMKILYSLIDGIPDKKVYMAYWRTGPDWQGINFVTDDQLNECGTAACALGWACAYPPFVAAGLKWDQRAMTPLGGAPAFEGSLGFSAAAIFFGITLRQSEGLFGPLWGYELRRAGESQKQAFLKRLAIFMAKERVITQERCKELIAATGE